MSDTQLTPQRTARINSERFDTELAAVWYAANFYYEASFHKDKEYIGVVFRDNSGRYGLTVRGDGNHIGSTVRVGDIPVGTIPIAVWHTHLPAHAGNASEMAKLFRFFLSTGDFGWDEFSGNDSDDETKGNRNDKALSNGATKRYGYRIPIYLITATLIKKYSGPNIKEKIWHKAPPSRMKYY